MKSVNFCVAGFAAGRNPIAQGETLNYNENLALIELQNYSELQWELSYSRLAFLSNTCLGFWNEA